MIERPFIPVVTLALLWTATARAEEAFYRIPIRSLDLIEGSLPAPGVSGRFRSRAPAMEPRATVDGEGEVYLDNAGSSPWDFSAWLTSTPLVIRAPAGKDVTGTLFVPLPDGSGMRPVRFRVSASAPRCLAADFHRGKKAHYERLRRRDIPGGAWFRHQARRAGELAGDAPRENGPRGRPVQGRQRPRPGDLMDTYDMFTGGRALSENLQLDRVLNPADSSPGETVDITTLAGITVPEIDWKSRVEGIEADADPLASLIPADQHVVFFPSFPAMVTLLDEVDASGTPVLQLLEPRSEDARTRDRYQRQLCLPLSGVARLLGPHVISSVAFTGSDPYLRTGSDVAILFETANPTALKQYVLARQLAAVQGDPETEKVQGELDGLAYDGAVSPDRRISSYVATVRDRTLVITNSLYQLGRLAAVKDGRTPAIGSLDEYRFFRHRYRREDPEETGFLMLTDATIRRWCSPKWRILASRRTRVAAVMAEYHAAHVEGLARYTVEPAPIPETLAVLDAGDLRITPHGVISSTHGSLDFLTPIAEIEVRRVTRPEADAYRQWSRMYQQYWRQFFDPVAVRFTTRPDRLAVDVTVMPLIEGTRYGEFINITRGAKLTPDAGDLHDDSLLHVAMALNKDSQLFRQLDGFAQMMVPGVRANPLGWLGQSIALYVDEDPLWAEARKAPDLEDFMEEHYHRLPIAVQLEVQSSLGVTAFLTALRGFIQSTAPDMTVWETLEHGDRHYVKISPSARARAESNDIPEQLAVYYAVTPRSLLITLNERVLKRALDRQAARVAAREKGEPLPAPRRPWLGENLGLQVSPAVLAIVQALGRETYRDALQLRCWSNLPILNEWKRLHPDLDPVEVHEIVWKTTLLCPGGGRYVWNDEWQTMESTVYGHPGVPGNGPAAPPILEQILEGNFGLTFEPDGLRARAVLERRRGE